MDVDTYITMKPRGNFLIPYVFDENVDHVRRDAFAAATQAWEAGELLGD